MVLLKSIGVPMGESMPNFSLKGIDGVMYELDSFEASKVLVLIFMCNHCPYVQGIWRRLNALQDKFGVQGVQLIGINPNTGNHAYEEETFEKMKRYANDYDMNFPYLEDADQSVSKAYKAQCTPDIYVYNSDRKLAYHGRLDDNWQEESSVTKEELAVAIELILAGKDVDFDQIPSMGCSIKWNE